jgi:hypothetical protein
VIPLHQREPFVKVFHNERQYLEFLVSGAKIDDLARAYVAVVINSNFSRDRGLAPLGESKSVALAPMLSYVEYAHIGLAKIRSSLDAYLRNKS